MASETATQKRKSWRLTLTLELLAPERFEPEPIPDEPDPRPLHTGVELEEILQDAALDIAHAIPGARLLWAEPKMAAPAELPESDLRLLAGREGQSVTIRAGEAVVEGELRAVEVVEPDLLAALVAEATGPALVVQTEGERTAWRFRGPLEADSLLRWAQACMFDECRRAAKGGDVDGA